MVSEMETPDCRKACCYNSSRSYFGCKCKGERPNEYEAKTSGNVDDGVVGFHLSNQVEQRHENENRGDYNGRSW